MKLLRVFLCGRNTFLTTKTVSANYKFEGDSYQDDSDYYAEEPKETSSTALYGKTYDIVS